MRIFTTILSISLLIGCHTQSVPHESSLMPGIRKIAEQAIETKYPLTEVAEFSNTAVEADNDVIVEYKRSFSAVATPENPYTRTMLDVIIVRMSGTNVISISRSQMEINRIPPSPNNI